VCARAVQIFDNAISCLSEEDRVLKPVVEMKTMLQQGIAVHHSGLLPILKEIIELLFQVRPSFYYFYHPTSTHSPHKRQQTHRNSPALCDFLNDVMNTLCDHATQAQCEVLLSLSQFPVNSFYFVFLV
jgi:hypothetical protein